jgi:hypothetical protein
MPGAKIACIGDLRFVASIDPALLEDALCFQFEDVWVGKHAAMDAKQPVGDVVDDQGLRCHLVHDVSLR